MCYTLHKYFSVRGNGPTAELNLERGFKCLFIGSAQPSLVAVEPGLLSTAMQLICILFMFISSNFPAAFQLKGKVTYHVDPAPPPVSPALSRTFLRPGEGPGRPEGSVTLSLVNWVTGKFQLLPVA